MVNHTQFLLYLIGITFIVPFAQCQVSLNISLLRLSVQFGPKLWKSAESTKLDESRSSEDGILVPKLDRPDNEVDKLIRPDKNSQWSVDIDGRRVRLLDGHRLIIMQTLPPSEESDFIALVGYVFHRGDKVIPVIAKLYPESSWCPFAEVTVDGEISRPRTQMVRDGDTWAALFDSGKYLDIVGWHQHLRIVKRDDDTSFKMWVSGTFICISEKLPSDDISLLVLNDNFQVLLSVAWEVHGECELEDVAKNQLEAGDILWEVRARCTRSSDEPAKSTLFVIASDTNIAGEFLKEPEPKETLFVDQGAHEIILYWGGWLTYSRNPDLEGYEQVLADNERNIATVTNTQTFQFAKHKDLVEPVNGSFGIFRIGSYYTIPSQSDREKLSKTSLTALLDAADKAREK
mmetsp:Transcript_14957/g.16596  ORF Transcript_14957/g.16596 Transcript_14957/m.16596 type:complete len:403 (-) Transcript_14957:195-1403(-)